MREFTLPRLVEIFFYIFKTFSTFSRLNHRWIFILPPANSLFGRKTGKKLNPEKWGKVNELATKFVSELMTS